MGDNYKPVDDVTYLMKKVEELEERISDLEWDLKEAKSNAK